MNTSERKSEWGWRTAWSVVLLVVLLVLGGWCAETFWLEELGRWAAYRRLVASFSMQIPGWASWDFQGMRGIEFTPSSLVSWGWCIGWSVVLWVAGCRRDKLFRPLWLLAALLATVGAIGLGDAWMGVITVFSVGLTQLFIRLWHRESAEFYAAKAPGLKPLGSALLLGISAFVGVEFLWDTSFAEAPVGPLDWMTAVIPAVLCGAGLSFLILRKARLSPEIGGAVTAAILAGCFYLGPLWHSPECAWAARQSEASRWVESISRRQWRVALEKTKLSEKEASVRRLTRPEDKTDWAKRRELSTTCAGWNEGGGYANEWLRSDESVYAASMSDGKQDLAIEAKDGGIFSEVSGWTALARKEAAMAKKAFELSLDANPQAPMRWLGLGLAAESSGDKNTAEQAFFVWCLLDPRAVFSPVWNRAPLESYRKQVFSRWSAYATGQESISGLNRRDGRRLERYARWLDAWQKNQGDAEQFIRETTLAGDYGEAVALVRERILLTLENPTPAKVGASISAATMLLADRHLNLGQCHEVFESMHGRSVVMPDVRLLVPPFSNHEGDLRELYHFPKFPPRAAVVVTRPMMPGWAKVCRFTEGGVGATLHDFEENLIVKILTYGRESEPVDLPEEWLRARLPRP